MKPLMSTNEKPFLSYTIIRTSRVGSREADLILKERQRIRQLIQVTYASSRDDVDEGNPGNSKSV